MTDTCASCKYFFTAPASAGIYAGKTHCHFGAPRQIDPKIGYTWPLVQSDETCGEGADSSTGRSFSSDVNAVPGTGGDGRGYLATSTTAATIASSGSIPLTTQLNLAYADGARVRATSTGSAAWMEGVVIGYDAAGLLTFTADLSSGSGSHTDWNINLAGAQGATGATGATGTGAASKGSFTFTATPLTVNDAAVAANSVILFTPTNAAAINFMAGISGTSPGNGGGFYVSAKTVGVSFQIAIGSINAPASTETFDYAIIN